MIGNKNLSTDYHLLIEEDLKDEFSDESSKPSSATGSLRSLRLPWHVLRIPFRHAIRITLALPLAAFIFAIVWAMYMDYDKAVNVICVKEDNRKVRNYLPSLSAAIGDFPISQAVWTLSIVIHAPPRFLYGSIYFKYFEMIVPAAKHKWVYMAWVVSVLEITGLVGLSVITSKQNLPFHAFCFATFLISSELYMVLQGVLHSSRTKPHGSSGLQTKSHRIKQFLTKLVILSTFILVFAYFRHEAFCEQGVYTVFCAVEYVIILSNMAFHGCAYWDFYDRVIVIDFCRAFTNSNSNSNNSFAWSF